jgi:plastocyanin
MTLWAVPDHAAAGGGCRSEPVTKADTTAVEIGEMPCFEPTLITVHKGDTVTWTNTGSLPHTVTGANASWGDYNNLLTGQSVSHTFDAAGSYPYYCLLHPGMVGAVVVTDAGSPGAASASISGSGVDGSLPLRDASESAGDNGSNAMTVVVLAVAVASAAATGLAGFALGRRRTSG